MTNVSQERNNWNFSHNEKWKQYWIDTELVPSTKEDKQLPFLINKLKEELDINKIETVLEVGVGYGRVAKAILETLPNLIRYDGMDISNKALQESRYYLRKHIGLNDLGMGYRAILGDFENDIPIPNFYDLVISVETMSTVPESISIEHWIEKMCKLSKKYVVNLDYWKTTNNISNNGHDYLEAYGKCYCYPNEYETPNPHELLYIGRVK